MASADGVEKLEDAIVRSAEQVAGQIRAAKEAISKALGLGMRSPMTWRAVEILNEASGRPLAFAQGELLAFMRRHHLRLHVSVTDERTMATAYAIAAAVAVGWARENAVLGGCRVTRQVAHISLKLSRTNLGTGHNTHTVRLRGQMRQRKDGLSASRHVARGWGDRTARTSSPARSVFRIRSGVPCAPAPLALCALGAS